MSVSDVIGNQTLEFLLTGGVPQLKSVLHTLVVDIFDEEINAYCFLHIMEGCTDLFGSKLDCIKRSMMADFPTEDGPSRTILYLISSNLVLSSYMTI